MELIKPQPHFEVVFNEELFSLIERAIECDDYVEFFTLIALIDQ